MVSYCRVLKYLLNVKCGHSGIIYGKVYPLTVHPGFGGTRTHFWEIFNNDLVYFWRYFVHTAFNLGLLAKIWGLRQSHRKTCWNMRSFRSILVTKTEEDTIKKSLVQDHQCFTGGMASCIVLLRPYVFKSNYGTKNWVIILQQHLILMHYLCCFQRKMVQ